MARLRALVVGAVATEEAADEIVAVTAGAFPRAQLRGRFHTILLGSDALDVAPATLRLIAHNCAAHLVPGGALTVGTPTERFASDLTACGFTELGRAGTGAVWQRSTRRTIHDVMADARDRLERLDAASLDAELEAGSATVVDIRIPDDRRNHGVIHPSIAIPRTVLEWRLDPTSGYAHPGIASFEQRVVVVCNEGYSSSVAAAALQDLGYSSATDLVGGVLSWIEQGFPVAAVPDDDELFDPPGAPGEPR